MLRIKETGELVQSLTTLDGGEIFESVKSSVDSGLHLTCYPEWREFWDLFEALKCFVSIAIVGRVLTSIHSSTSSGCTTCKQFLHPMILGIHVKVVLWNSVVSCHPGSVSMDTNTVLLCDVLHAI